MRFNVNEEYLKVDDNFEFVGTEPDDETQEEEEEIEEDGEEEGE